MSKVLIKFESLFLIVILLPLGIFGLPMLGSQSLAYSDVNRGTR